MEEPEDRCGSACGVGCTTLEPDALDGGALSKR